MLRFSAPFRATEISDMKTLTAAAALILSATTAMAEAPCQNPRTTPCQQACAMMGAKYVLLLRQPAQQTPARVLPIRASNSLAIAPASLVAGGSLEAAQRLAHIAGFSVEDIGGMKLPDISSAIAESCRP